jgi:hypothetical protein
MVMDDEETIRRLERMDFERSSAGDRLAIHTAINALESLEELKRLCVKICNTADQQLWNGAWDDCLQGRSDSLKLVVRFINGDPIELKKLAGEE